MRRVECRLVMASIAAIIFLSACSQNSTDKSDVPRMRLVKLVDLRHTSNEQTNRYPGVIDATRVNLNLALGGHW